MDFKSKIKEYFSNLNSLRILNLVKWGLLLIALICVILIRDGIIDKGVALVVFSLLFWACVIAFITLAIIIFFKKKKAKKNKSY